MPAMPPPVADERQALRDYLFQQQYAFHALAFGLTDDQARATPTVSALSIGALIKHVTGCQHMWMLRVAAAPEAPPADDRPVEERQAEYADEFVMRTDETLADVLARFEAQNAETLRLVETADLDAAVPVPRDAPWFPKDVRGVVGALGAVPHDRGAGPPRRAGRHHPGEHRRRHALRTARRPRGLGADHRG